MTLAFYETLQVRGVTLQFEFCGSNDERLKVVFRGKVEYGRASVSETKSALSHCCTHSSRFKLHFNIKYSIRTKSMHLLHTLQDVQNVDEVI